jgi:hypothetical protein
MFRTERPRRHHSHHSQPGVKGAPRTPRNALVLPEIADALDAEAREYEVSKSWIMAIALARHFGIEIPRDIDYRARPWMKRPRKVA